MQIETTKPFMCKFAQYSLTGFHLKRYTSQMFLIEFLVYICYAVFCDFKISFNFDVILLNPHGNKIGFTRLMKL